MLAHLDRRLCVAPMLDCTDRFYRYFLRLISRQTLLYTEMLTSNALIQGDAARLLRFDPIEHPLALQLAGHLPKDLAQCARLGAAWDYDEINLNLGCPSERAQLGQFGACLMRAPRQIADCLIAMREAVTLPVTVKHRIGIDADDSYGFLCEFVGTLAEAGCQVFIVHARKAWLAGLSPHNNRAIPPLCPAIVYQLKTDFPHLTIVLNGGVTQLAQVAPHLAKVDGVMIGRAAYQNPWILARADPDIFGDVAPPHSRHAVLEAYLPFVAEQLAAGVPLNQMTRHLFGLFHGVPGAKRWRRYLSEHAHLANAGTDVLHQAAQHVNGGFN